MPHYSCLEGCREKGDNRLKCAMEKVWSTVFDKALILAQKYWKTDWSYCKIVDIVAKKNKNDGLSILADR